MEITVTEAKRQKMDLTSSSSSSLVLVGQGAEGRLFEGTSFLGTSKVILVKERFPKTYRHPELDARLTKERMRAELRGILRAKSIGKVIMSTFRHNNPRLRALS
jgi:TP53 regulating kinase-like protein